MILIELVRQTRLDLLQFQRVNGCILADSVGLGKTFTALAVIKYYELRNKSVLVEAAEEVIVYAKLPRGFTIPTPGGNYNPDWAIALEANGVREIYFVAETKGAAEDEELRASEKQNIDSAKRYFDQVTQDVIFRTVSNYDELRHAIS